MKLDRSNCFFSFVLIATIGICQRGRTDSVFNDANWVSLGGPGGANNYVSATAVDVAGNLYIGGTFTSAGGVAANRIAKWDGRNWSPLGAGLNSDVLALVASETEVYVGGSFTTAGGAAITNIAKWDGTNWTSLGSGVNGRVWALLKSGNDLFVGGEFTIAGGNGANRIAKWDGNTWSGLGSGMNNQVLALAVSGSDLYAGGSFKTADGNTVNRMAKWDGSSWTGVGLGLNGTVSALVASGSHIYVGGSFTTATNSGDVAVQTQRIAKWDGSSWSSLGGGVGSLLSDFNSSVSTLALSGSDVYVGGNFGMATNAGGGKVNANYVAIWNGTGWTNLAGGVSDGVRDIAVSGTNIFVGGIFSSANIGSAIPVGVSYVARWNGSSWTALCSGFDQNVNAVAISGREVYFAGSFTTAGGNPASAVAKWTGSNWVNLGSGMNSAVSALAVSGNTVYAGGKFSRAGGNVANRIAKWDGNNWTNLGLGFGPNFPTIQALAVSGTDLYAGGDFSRVTNSDGSFIFANCVAKWDGTNWSSLGSGLTGSFSSPSVRALAVSGSQLYAGGEFTRTTTAGVTLNVNRIARWDGSSWTNLGSGMNEAVQTLAITEDGLLYAGGTFNFVTNAGSGALRVNYIARWNGNTWTNCGLGFTDGVYGSAASGTNLLVGGVFLRATNSAGPGLLVNRIAKWDGATWTGLGSGMNNSVLSLAVSGNELFAGGAFANAGGKPSGSAAKAVLNPLVFTSATASNGMIELSISGLASSNVVVEASDTFAAWSPVATNGLPFGNWQMILPVGTNMQQFYRARFSQ